MVDVRVLTHHKDGLLPRGVGQCNALGLKYLHFYLYCFGFFKKYDPYLPVVNVVFFSLALGRLTSDKRLCVTPGHVCAVPPATCGGVCVCGKNLLVLQLLQHVTEVAFYF